MPQHRASETFWQHVTKRPDGCWTYRSKPQRNGYVFAGAATLAHRLAYELAKGPIPQGMEVCHSCDFRACVNPDHLWLGTGKDNRQDCLRKGRHNMPSGDAHWSRRQPERMARGERMSKKLTRIDVDLIRTFSFIGMKQQEIAERFGVRQGTISAIIRGATWKETA